MKIQEYFCPKVSVHEGYVSSKRNKCWKHRKRKIASFTINEYLSGFFFLMKTTADLNLPYVCYIILLFVYIYIPTYLQGSFSF